jgi:predicted metal-dependent hydrolase
MNGPRISRGVSLFNATRFFDAHEQFEELWRDTPQVESQRVHLQGLVQLAVAFHHVSTANLQGASSVMERALRNLQGAEESFPELDLDVLRDALRPWREYLLNHPGAPSGAAPLLPRLVFRAPSR